MYRHRSRLLDAQVQRDLAESSDAQALDADIALLSKLMSGDTSAHDTFHSTGGRYLSDTRHTDTDGVHAKQQQVLMPSGRRLDAGDTVRVLWLYDAASQARWSDATMLSKIAAGELMTHIRMHMFRHMRTVMQILLIVISALEFSLVCAANDDFASSAHMHAAQESAYSYCSLITHSFL